MTTGESQLSYVFFYYEFFWSQGNFSSPCFGRSLLAEPSETIILSVKPLRRLLKLQCPGWPSLDIKENRTWFILYLSLNYFKCSYKVHMVWRERNEWPLVWRLLSTAHGMVIRQNEKARRCAQMEVGSQELIGQ